MPKQIILILFLVSAIWASDKALFFELPDLKGKVHKLEDFKGKVVVIDFWAVWCVTCRKVFPVLNRLREKYPEDEVAVLGISIDNKPEDYVAKFIRKAGLKYQVLRDPKGKTPDGFGIKAVPSLFVLDWEGNVLLKKEGFEGEAEAEEVYEKIEKWVGLARSYREKHTGVKTPENPVQEEAGEREEDTDNGE